MPPAALEHAAHALPATSLGEMSAVELMNRVDTKFIITLPWLTQLLHAMRNDYRILEIDDRRLFSYRTLYFDTPGQAMYRRHHNGRDRRHKVRKRQYVDTGHSFLEVKEKTFGSRCNKERIPLSGLGKQLNEKECLWLRDKVPYLPDDLLPQQWNQFTRITLVERNQTERVTIDTGLSWHSAAHSFLPDQPDALQLERCCIVEVKQRGIQRGSPIFFGLRHLGFRPQSFSKYCIGEALLHPQLKQNRFNETLRLVRGGAA